MRGKGPEISIVIPTYGSAELVANCLRSIAADAGAPASEIIVVDDSSPRDVRERLQTSFPEVLFLRTARNVGYGGAANAGLEKARGRYVVVSNDDVDVGRGALSRLLGFLEDHPDAGAAAPCLVNPDGTIQRSYFRETGILPVFLRAAFPASWLTRFGSFRAVRRWAGRLGGDLGSLGEAPRSPRRVANVMGAFFMMRRAVFDELRGFDSERFYLFAEEVDLFFRMKKAGWSLFYVPEARVTHGANQTVRNFQGRYVVQQYKSLLFYFDKHFPPGTRFLFRAALTPVFGAKLVANLVGSAFPGAGRSERRKRFESSLSILRVFFDKGFRDQNVLHGIRFRYLS